MIELPAWTPCRRSRAGASFRSSSWLRANSMPRTASGLTRACSRCWARRHSGLRSWSSASAGWCRASLSSAAGWKQRRDQSALRRGQRRQRLYAQDAAGAAGRLRGCDRGGRGEGLRDGARRAARHHPDGSGDAVGRRLGGDAAAQGRSADARHPHHRAVRACARGLPRKGACGGVRRVRHQTTRDRPAARGAAAAAPRTPLEPVFAIILTNATQLCEGNFAALWQYDGEALVGAAQHNVSPGFAKLCRSTKLRLGREGAVRKAALERRTVHVADITVEPGFSPVVLQYENARTVLAVPLLREKNLLGVVSIWRREVHTFTEQQIALVRTFADQAATATEDPRLLNDLRESLQQQTATADVLNVISPSALAP